MRFAPLSLLVVAPLAVACNSSPHALNLEITLGHETGAMKEKPAVAHVDVVGKTPDGVQIEAKAAPGGTLDFGQVDGDLAYQFEVTGTDGEGNSVLRGRSISGIVLNGVVSDTVEVFAQRLGEWARPPGGLAHSHTHAPAVFVGGRYLLITGGDAPKNTVAADEYDLFAWAGASDTTFPAASQTLTTVFDTELQTEYLFAIESNTTGVLANSFDGTTFGEPAAGQADGLKSFDEVIGGAAVRATDGRVFVIGGTRLNRPTDAVLELGTDISIKVHRLGFARAGAAAMWLDDVGLVVIGGSAKGPAVEILPTQGTEFLARDFPSDPTEGAGAVFAKTKDQVLLVGGTAAGVGAKTRLLDPHCTNKCTVEEVAGATPDVTLSRASGFALPEAQTVMVVGDEAAPMGMTRTFLIDYLTPKVTELPLKEPRWGATLLDTPNGQFAVMGGKHPDGTEALTVEMFFRSNRRGPTLGKGSRVSYGCNQDRRRVAFEHGHPMQHLERLVRELAALAPEERARVVAEAARRVHPQRPRGKLAIPTLRGGTAWVGGDMRREDLYGDDGR